MMEEDNELKFDPKIEKLLKQFSTNRGDIKKKLDELESLGADVNKMFPKAGDFRSRFALDDKIKASTAFYATILSYSIELGRSLKDEIDIRRRLISMDKGDLEQDVRGIINELRKKGYNGPKTEEETEDNILDFNLETDDNGEVNNG